MGLYNYIKTKTECPNCHTRIDGWQGKMLVDKLGYHLLDGFMKVKLGDIKFGEMHNVCKNCHYFVKYRIRNGSLGKPKIEKPVKSRLSK
ncbi:hypothetical protein HZB78_02800 [Candidatus Collierbacteria bacterium]|nr:hypothetical protein [Candidatus Collierbacteria bacterium]